MNNLNLQRSDLIAANRQALGKDYEDRACETADCPNDPKPFSCYCQHCEDEIYGDAA